LAADAEDAVRTLRELGVNVQRLSAGANLTAERWRETARSEGARQDVRGTIADAGSAVIRVQVALAPQPLAAPAGSYYVSLEQPLANLAVAALEPDTQNSFFANRLLRSLDDVPRAAAGQGQALVQPAGPCVDLRLHRRQLYAVRVRRAARRLGLDAVRPGLGHGGARCAAQKLRPAAACRLVDRAVCRDGLAGADRGGAADALGVLDRTGASGGRRRLLHR